MRKLFWCLVMLLLVVPSNDAQSRKAPSRVQLLEVGEFHGDEVNARTSSGWLGLFISKKESSLHPTSIRVSRVFDPIVDDGTKKITGKRVRIPQSIAPIFLIKNASMLTSGSVKTVLAEPISLADEKIVSLNLDNLHYRITVVSGVADKEFVLGKAKVQLTLGGIRQTIFSGLGKDAGSFSITWAGDLDGDGKLDLYVSARPHENVSSRRLLLSSQAGKGQLVREVVRFETTGC